MARLNPFEVLKNSLYLFFANCICFCAFYNVVFSACSILCELLEMIARWREVRLPKNYFSPTSPGTSPKTL
ncbi:hypothetical protein CISIN_1g042467mg [Citrus sinensis]|uniref:THH1/TOM1/TOM3 domain-containing protein n=1 Tax=Citrus sinensis TaxID=2711 RepID=A0A067GD31_CITSI|nr:hypothetical protein CISIN_1g042467mg [Citrus sinensis]